jgi:50S ribosomal subunit-associated GTPase HflX
MSKLKKNLSNSEIVSLERLKKSLKENVVTVTCVGLYNHGKSTLLNPTTLLNDL